MYVQNWHTADHMLHYNQNTDLKRMDRRKVANNTYLVREGDDIHVVFHKTSVVIYHGNGTMTVNSGGWLTMSTADRIRSFTPANLRIDSDRGRWYLIDRGPMIDPQYGEGPKMWFVDGMRLGVVNGRWQVIEGGLSDSQHERENRHNSMVNRLLTRYIKAYTKAAKEGGLGVFLDEARADCVLCILQPDGRTTGDHLGEFTHLLEHLTNGHVPPGLMKAAVAESGHNTDYWGTPQPRWLRAYFRQRLYIGAVSAQHGRRPRTEPPWRMTAQMSHPR